MTLQTQKSEWKAGFSLIEVLAALVVAAVLSARWTRLKRLHDVGGRSNFNAPAQGKLLLLGFFESNSSPVGVPASSGPFSAAPIHCTRLQFPGFHLL
jgi:prepilin-type N-terminal cleavage/methylation domain-containing protein